MFVCLLLSHFVMAEYFFMKSGRDFDNNLDCKIDPEENRRWMIVCYTPLEIDVLFDKTN